MDVRHRNCLAMKGRAMRYHADRKWKIEPCVSSLTYSMMICLTYSAHQFLLITSGDRYASGPLPTAQDAVLSAAQSGFCCFRRLHFSICMTKSFPFTVEKDMNTILWVFQPGGDRRRCNVL